MFKAIANIALSGILFTGYSCAYGQDSSIVSKDNYWGRTFKRTELVFAINWQGNWKDETKLLRYLEIGFAKSIHEGGRHGPVSFGIYLSEEIYFQQDSSVFGTKFGAYTHWLFDLGFATIIYTDFENISLKLRPELGVGMGSFRAVIGYNVPTVNNNAFKQMSKNNAQITIQVFIPVHKKEIKNNNESFFKLLFKK